MGHMDPVSGQLILIAKSFCIIDHKQICNLLCQPVYQTGAVFLHQGKVNSRTQRCLPTAVFHSLWLEIDMLRPLRNSLEGQVIESYFLPSGEYVGHNVLMI
jgi:hypothetical protein